MADITRVLVCDDALHVPRERGKGHLCKGSRKPPPSSSLASISLSVSRPRLLLPFPVARNSISLPLSPCPRISIRTLQWEAYWASSTLILRHLHRNLWILAPRTAARTHLIMGELRFNPRGAAARSHDFFGRIFSQGGWMDPLGELMVRERSLILHTRNAREEERAKQSKAAEQLRRRRV